MNLIAASVLFALEWYVYPGIMLCVIIPMSVVWVIEHRREKRESEYRQIFPEPCFMHMGSTVDGRQIWCHEVYGHDGPHTSEWGLTQAEIDEDLSEPAGVDAEEIWPVPEWKTQPPAKLEDHATFENLRMARPPAPEEYPLGRATSTACLRSSNCYLPDGHQEQCQLSYGD